MAENPHIPIPKLLPDDHAAPNYELTIEKIIQESDLTYIDNPFDMGQNTTPDENPDEVCATCPHCELITAEMLATIWTKANKDDLEIMADELNYGINVGMIDSEYRLVHFLGQCRHESRADLTKLEDLAHIRPSVLRIKWNYYKNNPAQAERDGWIKGKQKGNEQNIARIAYNGKFGNNDIDDGYKYRGRGLIHVTFKSQYEQFYNEYNNFWPLDKQEFVKRPELLETTKYAVRSALWWWVSHQCPSLADKGIDQKDVDLISQKVNKYDKATFPFRYNYVKHIYDSHVFKNICFNTKYCLNNPKALNPVIKNSRQYK